MPNYYAHLTFGQKVRDRASTTLQAQIDLQRQSFDCGLYGPDPLFFYHMGIPSRISREGHALHDGDPRIALERMRLPISQNRPFTMGFALGYALHYWLDHACHPFVYANCSAKEISHLAMEGEFDRFLMQQDQITPHITTPMAIPKDNRVYSAAALAFQTADEKQYRRALAGYYRISRLLTRFQGSVFCTPTDLITRNSDSAAKILLRRSPAPLSNHTNQALLQLWESAVKTAPAMLEQLFYAYRSGNSFDFLPQENFQGQPLPQPAI